jgi:Fe2+ transport system protein B
MATRTIENRRDRLARFSCISFFAAGVCVLIAAFVPASDIWGAGRLQGLVLLAMYAVSVTVAIGGVGLKTIVR